MANGDIDFLNQIVDRDVNRTCDAFSFLIIVSRGKQFLGTFKFGGAIVGCRKDHVLSLYF